MTEQDFEDRMALLRGEVSRRDEQVRNMSGELRQLRDELAEVKAERDALLTKGKNHVRGQ